MAIRRKGRHQMQADQLATVEQLGERAKSLAEQMMRSSWATGADSSWKPVERDLHQTIDALCARCDETKAWKLVRMAVGLLTEARHVMQFLTGKQLSRAQAQLDLADRVDAFVGLAKHSQAQLEGAPVGALSWLPIDSAPKRRERPVLVNDTNKDMAPWAAAKWLEGEEWSGWVYDDELLNDSYPLGPQPTHWLDVPAIVLNQAQEVAECRG